MLFWAKGRELSHRVWRDVWKGEAREAEGSSLCRRNGRAVTARVDGMGHNRKGISHSGGLPWAQGRPKQGKTGQHEGKREITTRSLKQPETLRVIG